MKILAAEDDPVTSVILTTTLQNFGHEVTLARDGMEAWEMFKREPMRIVVSDLNMPGLDGINLCRRIRERPMTEYTYFILLTGTDTSSSAYHEAMAAGVDDFMTKPMNRDLLRVRIHVAQRILRFSTHVAQLKDLLPICVYCHKINDGQDFWERLETYMCEHTGTSFSHGICPECMEQQLAMLEKSAV
jgi:sigma-B regulation protein RsbU (phosphoserine phosphatase)